MSWHGPEFVLTMMAIGPIAWVLTTWIRARHGYPLTDDNGDTVGRDGLTTNRKAELLGRDNEKLRGQVTRLEDRIAVLERIATDPAARTARDIELLRQEG